MAAARASHSELIAGTPEQVLDALTDFGSYAEWNGPVLSCRVLEQGPGGTVVEVVVDLRLRTIRYVLRYHADPPARLWWEYVEGDVRSIEGDYLLEPEGTRTRATYSLAVDPGRFVPAPVRRMLAETVMRQSVRDLKARVEGA